MFYLCGGKFVNGFFFFFESGAFIYIAPHRGLNGAMIGPVTVVVVLGTNLLRNSSGFESLNYGV